MHQNITKGKMSFSKKTLTLLLNENLNCNILLLRNYYFLYLQDILFVCNLFTWGQLLFLICSLKQ